MSSILIDAVLSSSPDHDALIDGLCWPSDSWPERERIEALTTLIDGIGKLPQTDNVGFSTARRQNFIRRVESIIWDQCLSLLFKISSECVACRGVNSAQDSRGKEMTGAVCGLLSVCLPLCDTAVTGRLTRFVLPRLQPSDGETEEDSIGPGKLHVDQAIDVMAVLVPALTSDEQLTTATLTSALSCIRTLSDALASKTIVRILFTLLNCYREKRMADTLLSIVLEDLCRWHSGDGSSVVTERTLLCLTALSDYLLPPVRPSHTPPPPPPPPDLPSARPDPRRSPHFWRILQDGLTHRDTVSRKRALYLLKRCVAVSDDEGLEAPGGPAAGEGEEVIFRWVPERRKLLREFWEDYALVMETLEENQIHVVRPVLNRIDVLIQTAANDNQGSGGALLHPSWLLCVYQRMFHSENKSVMKEGVHHLLELQALSQADFSLAFSQFIVGPFMDVLSESSLFHRAMGQCVGECPELGVKLQTFLVSFFRSLPAEKQGSVLLQLIQRLGSQHWCSVPILFLSQALAQLPPCPLLGPGGLQALRDVLRCTMTTHQILLRGAAQCFLLHSALCLTDVSSVTLDDVFGLLVHFPAEESLCRGTGLWNQLCVWLEANEDSFRPCLEDEGSHTGPPAPETGTIHGYVQQQMEAYLRVPACTDQTDSLPDPGEADRLARAVLLWADMEDRRSGGRTGGESEESRMSEGRTGGKMEALLRPLVDTLGRLSTNVYLPLRKTDKSLQLLLRLFQLRRTSGCTSGYTSGCTSGYTSGCTSGYTSGRPGAEERRGGCSSVTGRVSILLTLSLPRYL